MDQATAKALADLRFELAEIRSALGATQPGQAEAKVRQLVTRVEELSAWGVALPANPFKPSAAAT